MAPLLTTGPAYATRDTAGRIIRMEPCATYDEAITLASMARRNGLDVNVATPARFGCWGIYTASKE